jgi:hypothetical protein
MHIIGLLTCWRVWEASRLRGERGGTYARSHGRQMPGNVDDV